MLKKHQCCSLKKQKRLLDEVNSDQEIHPYLRNYPSIPGIFFLRLLSARNGDFADPPYIAYVVLYENPNKVLYISL